MLTQLNVDGICGLLDKLEGINNKKITEYKDRLQEHNINGVVLMNCELHELKAELRMAFGDWELFRTLVEALREKENSVGFGKGRGAGKMLHSFDEEEDGGANSPHIKFTSDAPAQEKKLEAPTPYYPTPSTMEIKPVSNIEVGSVTSASSPGTSHSNTRASSEQPSERKSNKAEDSAGSSAQFSQQSSIGSTRSLSRDDFVDEFIFETQSIHDVMEDMGMTDDESNDMEDTDPDSEVYDTVIHMPDDRRPEIPAKLLQDLGASVRPSTAPEGIAETSLTIQSDHKTHGNKSPNRGKFTVSAAKDDKLTEEAAEAMNRLNEKQASFASTSSAMTTSQTSGSSESDHAQGASFTSPRYSSDSSSDAAACSQISVMAEVSNPLDRDSDTTVEDASEPLLPSRPPRPHSGKMRGTTSRERLGPKLMEKLEKLSMDLEEEDPELSQYQHGALDPSSLHPSDKTPLMTPATSREHLNVRKANKVRDETGPSAFQAVTPSSSRASSLAASAASSRCGSVAGTPLPQDGSIEYHIPERGSWKKVSPSAASSRKGSTGSLNKQEKVRHGSSSSGVGSPGSAASPGTPKSGLLCPGGVEQGTVSPRPAETRDVMVNIDGQTVKLPTVRDDPFV